MVKWHWAREAWHRQTNVRKRLLLEEELARAGDEAEESEEAVEQGDSETDDGRPESPDIDGSVDEGELMMTSSSSSFSSIESRVSGRTTSVAAETTTPASADDPAVGAPL